MENYSQDIVKNIKQDDEEVLEQFTSIEVEDVKHEPERHFVCILPDDSESEIDETKKVKIILKKFDRTWRSKPAKLLETYFICHKCDFVTRYLSHLEEHLNKCKIIKKCDRCRSKSKSQIVEECGLCDVKFDCKNCKADHIDQVHRKGSSWLCVKCDYKTENRGYLRDHHKSHVKKFSCDTCKQNFTIKETLRNHQQQHRHGAYATGPEVKFECKMCVRSFPTKHGLSSHERGVHSKREFHCDVCGKIFKAKELIHQHMRSHLKVSCPICHHKMAEHFLKSHVEQHSSNKTFKCEVCKKVYKSNRQLKEHNYKYHEINRVQCDLCGNVFRNKQSLREHISKYIKTPCPNCKKMFGIYKLKNHVKIVHKGEKPLACDIKSCKQKFKNIKELNDHKRIHIGPQRYKCPKCDHQTIGLQGMKIHIQNTKVHNKKKSFELEIDEVQCDLCGEIFRNKSLLRYHMMNHLKVLCQICKLSINPEYMKRHMKSKHSSGETFLACNIKLCKQKFENVKDLNVHKRIHIGPQSYKCTKCNYEATGLQMINYHMKRKGHKA